MMQIKQRKQHKENQIRDLNPFTHGLLTLFFILGALFFDWRFVVAEVIIIFILASISDVFGKFFKAWLKSAFVLTVVVSLLQMLLLPGDEVVFRLGFLTVMDAALAQAINIASQIMGIFTPLIYFLQVVNIEDFVTMMQQSGVSPTVTYIVTAALNMIPQMRDRLRQITDAQKSRGVETEGNLITRMKAFFPIIGPVVLSSIADVEEKSITLEVRGFSKEGKKTIMHEVPDTDRDKILRKLLWFLIIVLVIVRVVTWFL